jgi:hypothetical protein
VAAVDAGVMQIQSWEGTRLSRAGTVLQGTTHDTVRAENWLRGKSIAKTVVEEGGSLYFLHGRTGGEARRGAHDSRHPAQAGEIYHRSQASA